MHNIMIFWYIFCYIVNMSILLQPIIYMDTEVRTDGAVSRGKASRIPYGRRYVQVRSVRPISWIVLCSREIVSMLQLVLTVQFALNTMKCVCV